MRNTKTQRKDIMIHDGAAQQPSKSHVSHAETVGRCPGSHTATVAVSSLLFPA